MDDFCNEEITITVVIEDENFNMTVHEGTEGLFLSHIDTTVFELGR